MQAKTLLLKCFCFLAFPFAAFSQHDHQAENPSTIVSGIAPQPLLSQALRLKEALQFLGSALSVDDEKKLLALQHQPITPAITKTIQEILDPYCLASIHINPESRVKVNRGLAKATLIEAGWVSFLVKVNNEAGVTAALQVESPNAAFPLFVSSFQPRVDEKKKLSAGQVANRFLETQIYRGRPLLPRLSGVKLEYAVLQIYSKEAGQKEAMLGFNIGQGSQDIGFRNEIPVLFDIKPSVKLTMEVKDEDGLPAMASFIITDGIEHILDDTLRTIARGDFRLTAAQREYAFGDALNKYKVPARLRGIYPLPSRRVAAYDEYPDFFFQPQVYRKDGEHVTLPAGKYQVIFTRGPEYLPQTVQLEIPEKAKTYKANFKLKRWINLSALGWFSADHHVHGAGCSHYESPEEGVRPLDMFRQALGEDLDIAAVLTWGPSWYYQKRFFTGKDDSLSTKKNLMRYDVEVSGFPSSHAGHIVLLRLKEDDYPGTETIEEWPSWTAPVLKWAKAQGGVVGYAHSGWGLEPVTPTRQLPNYVVPKMDNIGANEYIVTVTQGLVDFYSAGDTPASWELNMWYHTLNAGFTTRLSGETDFPCIFDERVGLARSYFKPEGNMSYDSYVEALKKGRSYVTDGKSHIIDFKVNGVEAGVKESKLTLNAKQTVTITAKVAAYLPLEQDEAGSLIASTPAEEQPYWHIERARIAKSRKIRVELVINGFAVDTTEITADGKWQDISFRKELARSSWVALRVFPSAHSNPVFVTIGGKPIAEQKSAEWCRDAVDQCWKMKQANIREAERPAARAAYDEARRRYQEIVDASSAR